MVGPRKLLGDTEKANVHDVHFEKGTSLFLQGARKFRKNKMAVTSCATIVILYIMSICASFIAPYSFDEGELEDQNLPPSWYALFMEEGFKEKLKSWAKAEENFDFMSDQPMVDRPDPSNIWEDQLTAAEPVAILSFFEKGSSSPRFSQTFTVLLNSLAHQRKTPRRSLHLRPWICRSSKIDSSIGWSMSG